MSREQVAVLLNLLGELEVHLDHVHDPELTELRQMVGATLAALYRANAEQRLGLATAPLTRH